MLPHGGMDVRRLLGQNVRRFRLASDMSQELLAERMGVDRAYVSGLELGQRNPTLLTLWHISQALEVGLPQLFDVQPSDGVVKKATKRAPRRK